jgi:hypothetical protein
VEEQLKLKRNASIERSILVDPTSGGKVQKDTPLKMLREIA